jgi:hypothetical protein
MDETGEGAIADACSVLCCKVTVSGFTEVAEGAEGFEERGSGRRVRWRARIVGILGLQMARALKTGQRRLLQLRVRAELKVAKG